MTVHSLITSSISACDLNHVKAWSPRWHKTVLCCCCVVKIENVWKLWSSKLMVVGFVCVKTPREVLTSPFLSCQRLGLTRSSASGGMAGLSSSLTLEEDDDSEGGTGELDGRSAGRIMLAGIRASTTASLGVTNTSGQQKHRLISNNKQLN